MSLAGLFALWFASGVVVAALWSIWGMTIQRPRQRVALPDTSSASTAMSEITVISATTQRLSARVQPLTVTVAGKFILDFTDLESLPLVSAQRSTSISWSKARPSPLTRQA